MMSGRKNKKRIIIIDREFGTCEEWDADAQFYDVVWLMQL